MTTSKDATAAAITGAQVIDAATTAEDIEARKQSMWHERARRLLEQALAELDDIDSIPTVTAALAAMRIEVGELPADEMDGYPFPGEDDSDEGCTCPPDLVARGGWSSRCPVHGGGLCAY